MTRAGDVSAGTEGNAAGDAAERAGTPDAVGTAASAGDASRVTSLAGDAAGDAAAPADAAGEAQPAGDSAPGTPDPSRFRAVLGRFCTGVTVVTGMDGDEPVGFACQAFAALSLDPPLVLFCPSRDSGSWQAIRRAGRFCVNVLGKGQRHVSQAFGSRNGEKFAAVDWSRSQQGSPLLGGVLSWVDCVIEAVHGAGDHYIVVGRVVDLGSCPEDRPLLFYRGDYTATEPPGTDGTAGVAATRSAAGSRAAEGADGRRADEAAIAEALAEDGAASKPTSDDASTRLLASAGPADPGLPGALLEAVMSWPRQKDWM